MSSAEIEKQLEELEALVEELIDLNLSYPIIVEGKKDKRALKELEIKGDVILLHTGTSLFNICEKLAKKTKEVIILTDWDNKGGKLCKALKEGLEANGVKYNEKIRASLARLCKKDIKDIQSLAKYLQTLRKSKGQS